MKPTMHDHWIRYFPELAPTDMVVCWAKLIDTPECAGICIVYANKRSPTGFYLFDGTPAKVKYYWTVEMPSAPPPD